MQAIPGGIKALVILISNEMPDENTIQPTCFSVTSSLISGRGVHDEFATAFKVLSKYSK